MVKAGMGDDVMDLTPYRYDGHQPMDLAQWSTQEIATNADELRESDLVTLQKLQRRLFAQKAHAVIVILQGMDTAGKDGLIRHVFSGLNPAGTRVESFKQPTSVDLEHDFLWRINQALPARGEIAVFNRSQYEDVLISRVHPEILVGQHLPNIQSVADVTADFFKRRYHDLRHYEQYLQHQGIVTYKFFLHLSHDEQTNRLARRLALPEKNWKFDASDLKERRYWADYQRAYTQMLTHTATKKHPWYIIPADNKPTARLLVATILANNLAELNPQYPEVTAAQHQKLQEVLKKLEQGKL